MNKVLAAMCLQQQPSNSAASANAQLTSLVAAGLLEQAATNGGNSTLSGLALALAGKSPLKASQLNAAANIIEHGEQKAILNDQASAENHTMTSPNQLTLAKALQHNKQQEQPIQATSGSSLSGYGPLVATNKHSSSSSSSLQSLLTSPRGGSYAQQTTNFNNSNKHSEGVLNEVSMVMGSPSPKTTTTTTTTTTNTTNLTNKPGLMVATTTTTTQPPTIVTTPSTPSSPSTCTATTLKPTLSTTTTTSNAFQLTQTPPSLSFSSQHKLFGDCSLSLLKEDNDNGGAVICAGGVGVGIGPSGGGIQDMLMVVMGSAASTSSSDHLTMQQTGAIKSSLSSSTVASNSCPTTSLSLSNQNQNQNSSVQNHSSSSTTSNCNSNNNMGYISGNGSNNNQNNSNNNSGNGGNGNNNNNNNLLTHDTTTGDRRDPSPYRCGHCHQVSNWKHVIQVYSRSSSSYPLLYTF